MELSDTWKFYKADVVNEPKYIRALLDLVDISNFHAYSYRLSFIFFQHLSPFPLCFFVQRRYLLLLRQIRDYMQLIVLKT